MIKRYVVGAVAAAVLGSVAVGQGSATTAPAFNFPVRVTVTNSHVVLSRSNAKRGWLAHFVIKNKSKQTIRFEVGGLVSKPVAPGKTGKLGAYLSHRGRFTYTVDNVAKKPLKNHGGLFVVQ